VVVGASAINENSFHTYTFQNLAHELSKQSIINTALKIKINRIFKPSVSQ
jgi:hypothetical protein